MNVASEKLNVLFSNDWVRIMSVFIVFIIIPITIINKITPEEVVIRPTHPAFIEDLTLATYIQMQLRKMGFDFHIMQNFDAMQVEVILGSVDSLIVTANILLYEESCGGKMLIISRWRYYNSIDSVITHKERIGIPHFIKGVFESVHEIDVIAVLYNFGIAAWDLNDQKIQMGYVIEYHARQFEYLLEQLQGKRLNEN